VPSIAGFDLLAVDLPFRKPFKHSAAERSTSNSIFVRCRLDDDQTGYGETLPREYVTGESRDGAFEMLRDEILPKLVGRRFDDHGDVVSYLEDCNGRPPGDWVAPDRPATAAWAAVDLCLLDAFGRALDRRAFEGRGTHLKYSGVVSSDRGMALAKSALKMRLFGIRAAKLKVDKSTPPSAMRLARWIMGRGADLRADANMAWTADEAIATMPRFARHGLRMYEQPLASEDLEGAARVISETGLGVMADESLNDAASLERLIEHRACTAVNVRVAKCGGLIASLSRCRRALEAGMTIQVGCQVGESSLLSSAHLALLSEVPEVTYAEGCFGLFLLREDPVSPLLQFGRGGVPPARPSGPGLGVEVDHAMLERYAAQSARVDPA
jgi:muconate cycloisomerase